MSYTQAELDALRRAYARGVRRVTYEGKTVEFDSAAELKSRIDDIERQLSKAGGKARPRAAYAGFSRGH